MFVAPADDPIHYDEGAIRILEGSILGDLLNIGASEDLLRLAHHVPSRMSAKPPTSIVINRLDKEEMSMRLMLTMAEMRMQYLGACGFAQVPPSLGITTELERLEGQLDWMRADFDPADASKVRGLQFLVKSYEYDRLGVDLREERAA